MDEFVRFLNKFRTRNYRKGALILVQGEVPDCSFVIKHGIVKSYNLTMTGEEKPIGFDKDHEIFPIAWSFGMASHVQFYYEAFTETVVYCVPTDQLRKFINSHPKAQAAPLQNMFVRHVNAELRVNALEQSKAPQKVLNTIHFLCLRFGTELKKNTVLIDLPLTQQDLANFIGLTRETTGIELKKLNQSGVLSYRKQNYVIRTDKLDDLLDEDYGHGLVRDKK